MTPEPVVDQRKLREMLREIEANPLEEGEVAEIADPTSAHEDPDLALHLENGIPVWWPRKHPETLEKLPTHVRSRWFLSFLAGELRHARETLSKGDSRSRRLTIAQSLLRTQSTLNPAELPTPELS